MTEIRFYHLQRSSLDAALPPMLEKTHARGQRAVVLLGSAERVEALASRLWTYAAGSFLPHGTARDGRAEHQPIWITAEDENPNGAQVLFLADGARSGRVADYALCVELFDGADEAAVTAARLRWREYQAQGHKLLYFQQDDSGRWEQKAQS
jgi:DNA polymerase III subunit chi